VQILSNPLRDWTARRSLRALRREADAELIAARIPTPRLAWRTEELVADGNRLRLGTEVADVVHAASGRLLPGASPLNRVAVRADRACLLELASRLCALDRPVQPRGILLVERLLQDPRSPLYADGGLARDVQLALTALEGVNRVANG
jgi:hypothetical protein